MDLLQGTLDMLALKTLLLGPPHGYGIAKASRTMSSDAHMEFGPLYPARKRLELKGWISAKWETSENNRRTPVYRLARAGRKQQLHEHSKWTAFVAAVSQVREPQS